MDQFCESTEREINFVDDCTVQSDKVSEESLETEATAPAYSKSRKLVTQKRKKIHMSESECFSFSASEEGESALSDPKDLSKNVYKDSNYKLVPVDHSRKRKRKDSHENPIDQNIKHPDRTDGVNHLTDMPSSQGFVSAANIYKFAQSTQSNLLDLRNKGSTAKPQVGKKGLLTNQSSILSFMKSSTVTDAPQLNDNMAASDLNPKRTVMYSPIKKIRGTIYINDSPSSSPSSSQGSSQCSQPSSIKDNSVVKQLFEAQKHVDSLPKNKKPSQTKSGTKSKFIERKHSISKRSSTASFDLENDSFDINAALNSDMDETFESTNQKKLSSRCGTGTSDKYGLLGSGSYPLETGVNYFERLPPEVLENIFCQLPMLDLCLNSNRVCLSWNDIIADEKFVPWKKLYHKLKKDIGTSRGDVQRLMIENGMTSPTNYLIALIRYMKNFKPVTATNMLQCLEKHRKYCWAKVLIEERLQDCLVHEEPNPWSVITTLVILSHSVYDIQEIIHCLSVSLSQCTSKEIIECLYCVATFLYAFKLAKNNDVWNGMHYRLFYALYLYENASLSSTGDLQMIMSESKGGQQSLMKYSDSTESVKLTHEQMRIVKYQPKHDEVIKIVAFAGTGKTTTLVKYTQLRPDKKFLLVVYNKSVSDHAKTKFPCNVTCKTGHALAFGVIGRMYAAARKLGNLSVYGLTQVLRLRKGDNLFVRAKFVLDTINHFLSSADPFITTAHCPDFQMDEKTGRRVEIDHEKKMRYVEDAEDIWKQMKDYNNKKVNMSHDGYLKFYQLTHPSLRQYDCILIDEAQDLTPAITDILLTQPQGKILVGDPHQQIYSFRGAVNAMERVRADTIFYLTQSFRFGPEISHVAACCLEVLKKEKKKTLVGSGKKGFIMGEQVGQLAVISRLNVTVFNEAVKKCCYSDEECKVAFVGGTDGFGFPMMLDMYALLLSPHERAKEGLTIRNKLISKFSSFGALEDFATKTMDTELLGKIRIVKNYHHNLPVVLNKIKSKCVRDVRMADYVFSTAHKAKGLEFSTVRVTDDYLGEHHVMMDLGPDMALDIQIPAMLKADNSDEGNLLYVAVTRAKNALQITSTINNVLRQAGETFRYPVLSDDIRKAGKLFKCKEIDVEFEPKKLTLEKMEVKLGDGRTLGGGLFSPQILTEDMDSFAKLLGLTEDEQVKKRKKREQIDPEHFY